MEDTVDVAETAARYNLMRQKLGPKGAATRQRILESVVELVNVQTGEVPSISMICRTALISKATFYQYFEDFNAVVIELLLPVKQATCDLAAMLAETWPEAELYDRAYAFVVAYFDLWEKHRVPLRLRTILADAGDKVMIDAAIRSIDPIISVLAAKLCAARKGAREMRDDHALAIALMSAISHVALIITHNVYPVAINEAIAKVHGYPGHCQHRALAHLLSVSLQNPEVPYRNNQVG